MARDSNPRDLWPSDVEAKQFIVGPLGHISGSHHGVHSSQMIFDKVGPRTTNAWPLRHFRHDVPGDLEIFGNDQFLQCQEEEIHNGKTETLVSNIGVRFSFSVFPVREQKKQKQTRKPIASVENRYFKISFLFF